MDWIKVSDRLPEEEQYVLYYCANYEKIDKTQFYYGFFLGVSTAFHNITHWMPLPKPPKIKTEKPICSICSHEIVTPNYCDYCALEIKT